MKLLCTTLVLAAALLATAGCGPREISTLQRKQAAHLVSEAQFAVTLRDYAGAEKSLAEAVGLCPDEGVYWVNLGNTRVRLGRRGEARTAYRHALQAFADAETKHRRGAEAALPQVYVLMLLGRVDEARALQDKLVKRYPDDRDIRVWVGEKRLDGLLADPGFRQFAL